MKSLKARAAPSQHPEITTAYHAAFAQGGESHRFWTIRPTEMTWKGTGRLSPREPTVEVQAPGVYAKYWAARVPLEALWTSRIMRKIPTTMARLPAVLANGFNKVSTDSCLDLLLDKNNHNSAIIERSSMRTSANRA